MDNLLLVLTGVGAGLEHVVAARAGLARNALVEIDFIARR